MTERYIIKKIKRFDWRKQRIYFSGFNPFEGGSHKDCKPWWRHPINYLRYRKYLK